MKWPRFPAATVVAVALWMLCGAYATQFVYRGWIAHDEGTIGLSAERVLAGEVPHRDFDEVYTGGLTYLHAAGMKVLGINLRTPRLIVFAFFMAFLAAVYAIGRRVSSPGGALVAMALAAVWSLPNYFVSLPSWYNLFFATFGVLALLYYLETDRRRWLVIAGVCGGFSVLAKISGLYYLAGGLLFLVYVEQTTAREKAGGRGVRSLFWPVAGTPASLLLILCAALLGSTSAGHLQLFAPALIICLFLARREWSQGRGPLVTRIGDLMTMVLPFAAGAVVPIVGFVLWYWQHDAVADLLRGVFVLPQRRLAEASTAPPPIALLGLAAPYLVLLTRVRLPVPRELLIAAGLAIALGAMLMLAGQPSVYRAVWAVVRATALVAALAGIYILIERRHSVVTEAIPSSTRIRVFLVVTMAAMVGLVQFPYATPIYFCYTAPMTILAVLAVVFARPNAPKRLHLTIAAFFLAFALVFVNRSYGWNLGEKFLPYNPGGKLELSRGGLQIPKDDKQTYEEVVRLLQQHAAGGTIYAGPDCPEIYFLAGFSNPTRATFEFLTADDERWMAKLLADTSVRAVVVNTAPLFSAQLQPDFVAALERRFPRSQKVGRFVVRFE